MLELINILKRKGFQIQSFSINHTIFDITIISTSYDFNISKELKIAYNKDLIENYEIELTGNLSLGVRYVIYKIYIPNNKINELIGLFKPNFEFKKEIKKHKLI
jgi:hypothetical protein